MVKLDQCQQFSDLTDYVWLSIQTITARLMSMSLGEAVRRYSI